MVNEGLENPQIDLDNPYWRELKQSSIWLERWQLQVLKNSEFWKRNRSKHVRTMFTNALTDNGFAEGDLLTQREESMDKIKAEQAKVKGIDLQLAMKLHETEKAEENLLTVEMQKLSNSRIMLSMAKRLYAIREQRKIHHDASKFNETTWIKENLPDLKKNGYDQKPANALKEIKNLIENHHSEWDRALDK